VPHDQQQTDTYYIVAHFHYVLFGGALFGLMSGLYYWWPKVFGRLLSEKLGKVNFWLWFIGFNLTFAPMHIVGLQGMPRRIYTYPEGMGWDFWNFIETIGAFTIAASVLVFLLNVAITRRRGEEATADPWDARTLEWSIPSPPPEYNFAEVPVVTHRDEWWHKKYVETPEGRPTPVIAGGADGQEEEGHHGIHMPSPSYFPILAAFGIPIMAYGVIFFWPAIIVGGLISMLGFFGWVLEPGTAE
jgi:cytochrome c oxidase subunit I